MRKLSMAFLLGAFIFSSCGKEKQGLGNKIARGFASLDNSLKLEVGKQIESGKIGLSIKDVVENPERWGAPASLIELIMEIPNWEELELKVPVDLHASRLGEAEVYWLFIPEKDDKETQELVAYNSSGEEVTLNSQTAPELPVITIGPAERIEMGQESMAGKIRSHPLVEEETLPPVKQVKTEQVHKLDWIEIENIHEPWYKGRAEVYMVVSFFDREGNGSAKIVELEAVDRSRKRYFTNKVFHFWKENKFQIFDIAFFEADSRHNYKDLAEIIMDAASQIAVQVDPEATKAMQD